MQQEGYTRLRLKHAAQSDGIGQRSFNLNDSEELAAASGMMRQYQKEDPACEFVLMPDLSDVDSNGERIAPRNISVNFIELPGQLGKYITIGEQIDLKRDMSGLDANGEVNFGGSSVMIVRLPAECDIRSGEYAQVQKYVLDVLKNDADIDQEDLLLLQSVNNGIEFICSYLKHMGSNFVGSVLGVDTLSGAGQVGLVADLRARVGGTDPALAALLPEFMNAPGMNYSQAQVELIFGKGSFVELSEGMIEVMNYIDPEDDKKSLQIVVRR
jgi:hypothetical protein